MAVCYNKLQNLLIDQNAAKAMLVKSAGITTNAIA